MGFGQRALDRFGARMAVLYLALALIGVPLLADDDRWWWGPSFVLAAVSCAVVFVIGLNRSAGWVGLLVMLAVAVATVVVSAGISGATPSERSGELANWVLTGICGGVAVARGRVWGVITLLCGIGAWVTTEAAFGSHSPAIFLTGPVVCTLAGIWVHQAAQRGFVRTDRIISAMADVDAARQVAQDRWDAAQQDGRWLHDTVLNTLTVLAHGGVGLSAREIRDACARDLEILSGRVDPHRPVQTPDDDRPGDVAAGVQELARQLGLELTVHGAEVLRDAQLDPAARRAVAEALSECLRNVRQHSGVQNAALIVSVAAQNFSIVLSDEGRGFEPDSIPADRLGLLASVRERIAEVGGEVRVWSRPGRGTSVLINLPATGSRS